MVVVTQVSNQLVADVMAKSLSPPVDGRHSLQLRPDRRELMVPVPLEA